ncbi:PKD domain-containing protein [Flaviaesturariibacter aridisoli]|uniref:PKD domain-containing protein n=1 Tax=Flaviaesturariibacter aridisoli TaxID=2545761 RepID=A0A4R4E2Q7_9BACT|nr:PKD domain-containing protein [Flaviaesturariibacter aridisoli]TCZ71014.1 PKD domain-containing protein [Flaviaesturariibacter aridisoli]
MHSFYSKLTFLAAFVLCALGAAAQVSVTATTGTLGPTSYTTLKGAFDAINAGTHKGTIQISITGNTTEMATASLLGSTGTASYTSVLIKPAAGTTPVISTGTPFAVALLELNGATNVTIDGSNTQGGITKDLTISNADTLSNCIRLINGASNNAIRNCVIKGSTFNSGVLLISSTTAAAGNNNNLVENNDFTNSSTLRKPIVCIYNTGTSGKPNSNNIYRNNRVMNFATYGIMDGNGSVGYSNNTLIERNEIFGAQGTGASIFGIRINQPTGVQNMTLHANYIHDLSLTSAGTIYGVDFYDVASFRMINNIIRFNDATSSIRAIAQESAASQASVLHNTVVISGTASGAAVSFNYLKNYTSTNDSVFNNIFVNTRVSSGTGKQYAILSSSPGGGLVPFKSNYNDLYSTGNALNFIGGTSATTSSDYTTLSGWQTGNSSDANSISLLPTFVSATDLHISPSAAGNSAFDNKGTNVGVTVDYDAQARSGSTPDIGADEFTYAAACTPPTATLVQVDQAGCPGSNASFLASTTGTAPLTFQWKKQGVGPIAGATTNGIDLPGITAANAGYYYLVVSNACGVDSSGLGSLTVFPRPVSNFTNSVPGCAPATVNFTGTSTISSGNVSSYFYQFGDGQTAQVQNPSNTYAAAGVYNVKLISTSSFNCSDTVTKTVTIGCTTAVSNLQAGISEAALLPTAVRDDATIRVSANRSMTISWTLVDGSGRIVRRFTQAVTNGNGSLRISLNGIAPGSYQLLGYSDKGKATTLRFLKL